jgi:hypothetical protein
MQAQVNSLRDPILKNISQEKGLAKWLKMETLSKERWA